jgi:16S rRNA (guanine527-N7)-methyltransferase
VDPHIDRALDLGVATSTAPGTAVDLGSGGGLPGLPLALAWPDTTWFLLDGGTNRAAFLREAVIQLGLSDRVEVVAQRAEETGRGILRGTVDCVVARSFGPPAVTAECAAPLLRVGGVLVVAEPPGGDLARWDEEGLALLGMRTGPAVSHPTAFQVIVQETVCPERFPRRTGVPSKRPLF